MPNRKRFRARRGATNMMLLNNPASGVPLAHNAANLELFISPRGYSFSNGLLTPDRGNCTFHNTEDTDASKGTVSFIDNDGLLYWDSSGITLASGIYPKIPAGSDALWVMSGRYTNQTDSSSIIGEAPSMTFRIGDANSVNQADKANVRIRDYVFGIGDHIEDSAGNVESGGAGELSRTYKIDAPNLSTTDPNYYISIAALDRSANLWRQIGFRGTEEIVAETRNFDISSYGFGSFNFKTNEETGSETSTYTINGAIAGYSLHVFPDGLPADWEDAALLMGLAWQQQNYTFWNPWGTE